MMCIFTWKMEKIEILKPKQGKETRHIHMQVQRSYEYNSFW